MHVTAGASEVFFKLQQVAVQVAQSVGFDRAAGLAKLFPIGHFVYDFGPLGADHVCRVLHIAA